MRIWETFSTTTNGNLPFELNQLAKVVKFSHQHDQDGLVIEPPSCIETLILLFAHVYISG